MCGRGKDLPHSEWCDEQAEFNKSLNRAYDALSHRTPTQQAIVDTFGVAHPHLAAGIVR